MSSKGKLAQMPSPEEMYRRYFVPRNHGERNSDPISVRIPETWMGRIDHIILECRDKLPIKKYSDFYRVAVWRLLCELEKEIKDPKFSKWMMQSRMMLELAQEEAGDEHFESQIGQLQTVVDKLVRGQHFSRVTKMLRTQKKMIHDMPPGYWKDRWVVEFNKRFSQWIKGISLTRASAEDEE